MSQEQEQSYQDGQPTEPVDLHCPVCGQLDRVERMTAVFYGGISYSRTRGSVRGSGVGYGSGSPGRSGSLFAMYTNNKIEMSGTSQTAISKMFSPPPSPVVKYTRKLLMPWAGLSAISLGCFIFSLVFISNTFPPGSQDLAGTLITGAIPIFLAILFAIGLWRFGKNLKKYKALLEVEYPAWRKKMSNWSRLYYCSRDAIVFLPGSGRYAEADAMYKLL